MSKFENSKEKEAQILILKNELKSIFRNIPNVKLVAFKYSEKIENFAIEIQYRKRVQALLYNNNYSIDFSFNRLNGYHVEFNNHVSGKTFLSIKESILKFAKEQELIFLV